MPVVAVAGGTGKLGRAIVDAVVADGKYEAIVLAREANKEKEKEVGARILAADYNEVDGLASLFEHHKVDIVISTINAMGDIASELNLIKAADKSSVTKRYMPSIWGVKFDEEVTAYFPMAGSKIQVLKTLEATSLEWTAVVNGYFLDYFVAPQVKSYMQPMPIVLDIPANFAAIPGSGDVPVVFTHTFDIAKFVAAALSLPKWEKFSYIIGDKVTLNQFVKIAEEAKGSKFTVKTDPVDKLKTGQITELPSHPHIYPFFPKKMLQGLFSAFGLMFENSVFDLKPARTLNDDFPDIKARSVKQLVFEAYKTS